jgi:hypothetical protein
VSRKGALWITIAALLSVTTALVLYKVLVLGYSFANPIPRTSYAVELSMNFTGIGEDLFVRTFLPVSDETQTIADEVISAPALSFRREQTPLYVIGEWSSYNAEGPYQVLYSFSAQIRPARYECPPLRRLSLAAWPGSWASTAGTWS